MTERLTSYSIDELKEGVVRAIKKCDLTTACVLQAWINEKLEAEINEGEQ